MNDDGILNDREALAAEYALGVLDRAERQTAEALIASDASFAAAVARWKSQLSHATELATPVAPPSGLWDRIDAEIAPPSFRPAQAATAERPGFWASLNLWRGLSFASTAAAAALAVVALTPDKVPTVAPAPVQVAQANVTAPLLMAEGDRALVAAAFDPNSRQFLITPATGVAVPKGRTMELWIIIGDKAPRSLGVIKEGAAEAHILPKDVRADLAAGATLAISIEPMGGSKTGAPTGPVVATGKLTAV